VPDPFMARPDAENRSAVSSRVCALRETATSVLENLSFLGDGESPEDSWRFAVPERFTLDALSLGADFPPPSLDDLFPLLEKLGKRSGLILSWECGTTVVEDSDELRLRVLDQDETLERTGSLAPPERDFFAALNARHFRGGAHVHVPAGVCVADPVVILHWVSAAGVASFSRSCLTLAASSSLPVVEMWVGTPALGESLVAGTTEVFLEDGAALDLVSLQQLPDHTLFVGSLDVDVRQDAKCVLAAANVGGAAGRFCSRVFLNGEGASLESRGVYIGDGERHVDFRTEQLHQAARTTSNLLYRGAVCDSSRSVYAGLIRILADAEGCQADQASHSLILAKDAAAVNIPNLEIFNHDVKCGHSASSGPPDPDQLYYLESRGIAPERARHLLVDGFFSDVIDRFPVPGARSMVNAEVQRRLAASWKE